MQLDLISVGSLLFNAILGVTALLMLRDNRRLVKTAEAADRRAEAADRRAEASERRADEAHAILKAGEERARQAAQRAEANEETERAAKAAHAAREDEHRRWAYAIRDALRQPGPGHNMVQVGPDDDEHVDWAVSNGILVRAMGGRGVMLPSSFPAVRHQGATILG